MSVIGHTTDFGQEKKYFGEIRHTSSPALIVASFFPAKAHFCLLKFRTSTPISIIGWLLYFSTQIDTFPAVYPVHHETSFAVLEANRANNNLIFNRWYSGRSTHFFSSPCRSWQRGRWLMGSAIRSWGLRSQKIICSPRTKWEILVRWIIFFRLGLFGWRPDLLFLVGLCGWRNGRQAREGNCRWWWQWNSARVQFNLIFSDFRRQLFWRLLQNTFLILAANMGPIPDLLR